MTTPTERRVNGLNIVERPGVDPTGPLVVLVHGVNDSCASFFALFDLMPDHHFITYDRRGYGTSDFAPEGPRPLAEHTIDLFAVMDGRPAVVVGHSMGGNVAMVAAFERPEQVMSASGFEVHAPWLDCWDPAVQENVLALAADPDPWAMGESTYRRMKGDAWFDALPDDLKQRRREEAVAFQQDLRTGFLTEFAFKRAAVPCVFGNGARTSPFFADASRRFAETMPGGYLEIAAAKHSAHITHPAAFVEFVQMTIDAGTGTASATGTAARH